MKKLLSLLLALTMVFALCACGAEKAPEATPAAPEEAPAPAAGPVVEEVRGVTVPNFAVMINGVKVDQDMMAEYPLYSVQATSTNSSGTESTVTYVGFVMKDVFAAAGLSENYVWLEATADDGYAVTYEGDIMGDATLLAVTKDGTQFNGTPWFAPCASDTTGDYLKGCVGILVNTVASAPEGISNEAPAAEAGEAAEAGALGVPDKQDKTEKITFEPFSFKVNGAEITNDTLAGLSIYKVSVSTENSKGAVNEATYTGYVLSDVLQACGVENYSTVKVIANDGYASELTPEQAASEFTIVAIEKDKELGEGGTIWVAPCTEPSSGSYAKLVVEITAE